MSVWNHQHKPEDDVLLVSLHWRSPGLEEVFESTKFDDAHHPSFPCEPSRGLRRDGPALRRKGAHRLG